MKIGVFAGLIQLRPLDYMRSFQGKTGRPVWLPAGELTAGEIVLRNDAVGGLVLPEEPQILPQLIVLCRSENRIDP